MDESKWTSGQQPADRPFQEIVRYGARGCTNAYGPTPLDAVGVVLGDSVDEITIFVVYNYPIGVNTRADLPAYAVIGGHVYQLVKVPDASGE